jgi:hypothetical protein
MFEFIGKKLLLLIFVVSGLSVSAQYYYASYNYYTIGLKGGYDNYTYTFDENQSINYEAQPNFSIGVTGGYYISWLFEAHADLRYSTRNFNIRWSYPLDPQGAVPALSEYQLAYIQVPIQGRINAVYTNWVKLSLGTGLLTEFRLRPQERVTYQNGSISESQKSWLTKDFTAVLVGIPFSANLKINLSRHVALEFSGYYYLYLNKMHQVYMTKPGSSLGFYGGVFYEW